MRWGVYGLFGGLLVCATGLTAVAQGLAEAELKASHVQGNIYMLHDAGGHGGTGGNIGVSVGEDGVLLVDDKFAPLADKIRAAVQKIGGGELQFVLNTHFHGDHTGGNQIFGREVPIIAHTNVRKRLMTEQQVLGRTRPPLPKDAWPVITFDQWVSLHFNGEEIKVIHFPTGHTDGDSIIFFTRSNVVHMGDELFTGRFPFVDLSNGGDVEGLIHNIAAVIERLPPTVKVIPGHGPISTLEDVKAYHRMLVETTEIVRRRIMAGQSLVAIQSKGLPAEWQFWGTGFISVEMWIKTLYRSLSR